MPRCVFVEDPGNDRFRGLGRLDELHPFACLEDVPVAERVELGPLDLDRIQALENEFG
jgi:hypothetical protein